LPVFPPLLTRTLKPNGSFFFAVLVLPALVLITCEKVDALPLVLFKKEVRMEDYLSFPGLLVHLPGNEGDCSAFDLPHVSRVSPSFPSFLFSLRVFPSLLLSPVAVGTGILTE